MTDLAAIAPAYGEHSLRFSTIEAGLITQLLETEAASNRIGLCQIGSVEFDRIRHLFDLDETHVLIHSLVGGRLDPASPLPGGDPDDDPEEEDGLI